MTSMMEQQANEIEDITLKQQPAGPAGIVEATVQRPRTARTVTKTRPGFRPYANPGWTACDFGGALVCGLVAASLGQPRYGALSAASFLWALAFGAGVAGLSRWTLLRQVQPTDGTAHEELLILKTVVLAAVTARGLSTLFLSDSMNRVVMESEVFLTFWTMVSARALWRRRQLSWRRRGNSVRNFAIAGVSQEGRQVRDYLTSLRYAGYHCKGFIALDAADARNVLPGETLLGSIDNIVPLARSLFVDEIFLMRRPKTPTLVQTLEDARAAGMDVSLIPGVGETLERRTDVHYVGDMPTITLHRSKTQELPLLFKRLLDVTVAVTALVVLSPLMLALAIAVMIDSPGPVFYGSDRVGRKGRIFRCYKFRTMVRNAHQLKTQLAHLNERDGVLFKITRDPRITRLGRVLRKYSLDELPQLWNVLLGDMSLVGPRPPIGEEVAQYRVDQFCRLEVMPGITGLWQVEARADPSFENYIELDRKYVNEWTFWFDLKILFRTVNVVLRGTGS
jgi:exopolysaccharide biosynthesis polyprenyl glycosylphosphotransferase